MWPGECRQHAQTRPTSPGRMDGGRGPQIQPWDGLATDAPAQHAINPADWEPCQRGGPTVRINRSWWCRTGCRHAAWVWGDISKWSVWDLSEDSHAKHGPGTVFKAPTCEARGGQCRNSGPAPLTEGGRRRAYPESPLWPKQSEDTDDCWGPASVDTRGTGSRKYRGERGTQPAWLLLTKVGTNNARVPMDQEAM
jgi:hypothetical protein